MRVLGPTRTTAWLARAVALVANFSSLTGITIQTSPPGLQFSVDGGTALAAPQTLPLSQGTHTISVATTQAGGTGTQYVFTSWSDGGRSSSQTPAAGQRHVLRFWDIGAGHGHGECGVHLQRTPGGAGLRRFVERGPTPPDSPWPAMGQDSTVPTRAFGVRNSRRAGKRADSPSCKAREPCRLACRVRNIV